MAYILGVGLLLLLAGASYFAYRKWQTRTVVIEGDGELVTEGLDYSDETARQHIHILLCVIQQEQIALSEAAVRLTAFMRELPSEAPPKELLAPFESLAKVTSHIPIYDDFLSLPESEQQHYDEERHLLEQAHREDLLSATSELLKVFS